MKASLNQLAEKITNTNNQTSALVLRNSEPEIRIRKSNVSVESWSWVYSYYGWGYSYFGFPDGLVHFLSYSVLNILVEGECVAGEW